MPGCKKEKITGWGRFPVSLCETYRPEKISDLTELSSQNGAVTARGSGRSYGDAALCSESALIKFERLNRFRSFDVETGILTTEAGTTLQEILQFCVPGGWFLPVTPGTRYCTVGGCFACDVHGKNHHTDGSFSHHVHQIELLTADNNLITCSREENSDIFCATAGGMGLTGLILSVTLQLVPIETAFIVQHSQRVSGLDHSMEILKKTENENNCSVAWIDCLAKGKDLGRGIVYLGNSAKRMDLSPGQARNPLFLPRPKYYTIPFSCPGWLLNRASIRAFNSLYYKRHPEGEQVKKIIDYNKFYYPLDTLHHWNRMYGRKGFVQYQCVFPDETSKDGLREILECTSAAGAGSFLGVLKRFGALGDGMLSFPMPGFTLALDFAVTKKILPFLDQLDKVVMKWGGRVYLAKDARLSAETFRAMHPNVEEWLAIKKQVDPNNHFTSALGRRLGLS